MSSSTQASTNPPHFSSLLCEMTSITDGLRVDRETHIKALGPIPTTEEAWEVLASLLI